MSRFSLILKGTKATNPVDLPLDGGTSAKLLVRPLNGREVGECVARARSFAVAELAKEAERCGQDAKAIPEPREGDRLYDFGYMLAALLFGCLDSEDARVPFFASVDEILDGLDVDRIALLYEAQQAWQEQCAPRPKGMDGRGYIDMISALASEEDDDAESPFFKLPRSTQLTFLRTLTRQFATSLVRNSQPSSAVDSAAGT